MDLGRKRDGGEVEGFKRVAAAEETIRGYSVRGG